MTDIDRILLAAARLGLGAMTTEFSREAMEAFVSDQLAAHLSRYGIARDAVDFTCGSQLITDNSGFYIRFTWK